MINIDDRILAEVDENQLFLLCAIAKHMGNNAKAWPSNKTLCETTRWSANKLQRVKKSAIEAGILGAESRFQKSAQTSNLYQIKTRRIGVMVNLADIAPHPQNGVSPHPQNGVSPHPQNGVSEVLTNEVLTNQQQQQTQIDVAVFDASVNALIVDSIPLEAKEVPPPPIAPPPAPAAKKSCHKSCGPGDFREGGKCDVMGCYTKAPFTDAELEAEAAESKYFFDTVAKSIRYDPFDIDREAQALKEDYRVCEKFAIDLGMGLEIAKGMLPGFVDTFVSDQKAIENTYNNRKEFRTHFFNLVRKKAEIARNAPGNGGATRTQPPINYKTSTRY